MSGRRNVWMRDAYVLAHLRVRMRREICDNLLGGNTIQEGLLDALPRHVSYNQIRKTALKCDEEVEDGNLKWIVCRKKVNRLLEWRQEAHDVPV